MTGHLGHLISFLTADWSPEHTAVLPHILKDPLQHEFIYKEIIATILKEKEFSLAKKSLDWLATLVVFLVHDKFPHNPLW